MKYLPSLPNYVIMTEDMTSLTSNSILDANIGNVINLILAIACYDTIKTIHVGSCLNFKTFHDVTLC